MSGGLGFAGFRRGGKVANLILFPLDKSSFSNYPPSLCDKEKGPDIVSFSSRTITCCKFHSKRAKEEQKWRKGVTNTPLMQSFPAEEAAGAGPKVLLRMEAVVVGEQQKIVSSLPKNLMSELDKGTCTLTLTLTPG